MPAAFDPRASRGRRHGHAPHDSKDASAAPRSDSPKPETATLIGGRDDDNDDGDDEDDNNNNDAYGHDDDQAWPRPSHDNTARQDEDMSTWTGRAAVKGGSETMRMVLLTCSSIGVSFTWGVEMTYCTPYLLSLGLTKGQTSLVWLAGPLSGLIVQPVVGVMSDGSRSQWGRRRPFIAVCSVIMAMGLFTLGFTREIVGMFVHVPPPSPPADTAAAASEDGPGRLLTMVLAVLALYVTDFAINAVMSCSRSLMVDTLPMQKQQSGAAWGGRMGSIGHILGYGAGAIDLVGMLGPGLGDTQFKKLTLIAGAGILATSALTCWAVSERVLVAPAPGPRGSGSPQRFKVFRQIWSTLLALPPRIRGICWAVFWSWIGWYPFLIYSSTWVGETYFRYDVPADANDSKDALGDMGRIGSYALTVYSFITVLGAWILPLLVRSPDDSDASIPDPSLPGASSQQEQGPLAILHRRYPNLARFLARSSRSRPDLLSVWICAHLMFAAAMSLAPFAASFRFATALVAFCGIPWTISMWAPTALMGVEVNRLSGGGGGSYRRLSTSSLEFTQLPPRSGSDDHAEETPTPGAGAGGGGGGGELSGIYFGILNIYITLPQFASTFVSTLVFAVLDPGKSHELSGAHPSEHSPTDGPNAIAICLFIGAISAIGAALATRKLKYL